MTHVQCNNNNNNTDDGDRNLNTVFCVHFLVSECELFIFRVYKRYDMSPLMTKPTK